MKKSLVLASLLAIGTSAIAMDAQYFVGAGFERGDSDVTAKAAGVSLTDSFKDNALKLKGGAIINNNHRVSLSYAGYSKDGGDLDLTLVNYDYILPIKNKFSVLMGAHLGNASYDDNTFKDSGLAYGIQIGGLYDITENVSFEAGLSYTKYSVKDTETVLGVPVTVEIDKSTSIYLGFNYKF